MNEKPSFFGELKRRNVYKVAVAYAVVGWLVIQVCATIVPALHMPEGITTAVVILVLLGFPVALVIAWAFEMTPEGMKRTEEVSPDQKLPQWSRRKFAALVVTIALIASGLLIFKLVGTSRWDVRSDDANQDTGRRSAASLPVSDKSIAVLPLVNQSGDAAQEYFSDGLTEELINGLGQIPELRVIGRNSSFYFKGKGADSRSIGQALGVANLVEGSVRKYGDQLRIAIQLVNAADGTQRWSETYNRELKDIFAVQEEIARAVAQQLRAKWVGGTQASSSKPSNENLAAYNALLQAKYHFEKADTAGATAALPFLDEAIRLDPNYAEAYVLKSRALYFLALNEGAQGKRQFEQARAAAQAALALNPDLAAAHAALAYVYLFGDWNIPAAEAELSVVQEKNANALNNLANLRLAQARLEESATLQRETIGLEPLHAVFYSNLGIRLLYLGRFEEAEAAVRKAVELRPSIRNAHALLAVAAILRGDRDAASREAELEPEGPLKGYPIALARFARGERTEGEAALQKLVEQAADISPSRIALVYAFIDEPDKVFEWCDRAYTLREPIFITVVSHPFFARYRSDPRFVELCRKMNVPVPK